jgi:hypothetical protein
MKKVKGLRALLPDVNYSWLALKGGFISSDGEPNQIKPQDKRGKSIHLYGLT